MGTTAPGRPLYLHLPDRSLRRRSRNSARNLRPRPWLTPAFVHLLRTLRPVPNRLLHVYPLAPGRRPHLRIMESVTAVAKSSRSFSSRERGQAAVVARIPRRITRVGVRLHPLPRCRSTRARHRLRRIRSHNPPHERSGALDRRRRPRIGSSGTSNGLRHLLQTLGLTSTQSRLGSSLNMPHRFLWLRRMESGCSLESCSNLGGPSSVS